MNRLKSIFFTLLVIITGVMIIDREETQAQSDSPIIIQREQAKRHQITCKVKSLDDISVSEGLSIQTGDTVCSDSAKLRELQERKTFLESAIASEPSPLQFVPIELPPADFSKEETAVTIAKARLTRLEQNPPPELNFFNMNDSRIYEPHAFNSYLNYQDEIAEARYHLAQTIANLNNAKINRKQEEFQVSQQNLQKQHSIIVKQQEMNAAWMIQKNQLSTELSRINENLQNVRGVISPVSGNVHRVRFLNQDDENVLSVQIVINYE